MSVGGRMRHVHHAVSAALPVLFAYVQTAKVRKPNSPFALTLFFLLAVVSSIWRWRRNKRAHSTPSLPDRANTADKKGIQTHPKAIALKHEALLVQPKTSRMLSKLSSFLRKQRIQNQDCRVSQQASPKTVAQADYEAFDPAVCQETLRAYRLSSSENIRAALTRQSRTLLNKAVFKTAFTLADRIDAIALRGDFIDLRAAVAIYYTESLSRGFAGVRLRCLDSRENMNIDRFLVASAAAGAAHCKVSSTSASCHDYLEERMRSVLRGAAEQRRHDLRAGRKVRRDLLSSMLSVSLHEGNNKELVETLLEFLCPGLDTMTTSVCNALQLLAQDPIWIDRAQTEVDGVLGDESSYGPGCVIDIDRLPIIRGIFLESLRLFSAPSDRLQKQCFFNPARWVSSGSFCAKEFRLFTKDKRTIPGKHVASLQATALLAVLIARFDFFFLPENETTNDRVTVHVLPRST